MTEQKTFLPKSITRWYDPFIYLITITLGILLLKPTRLASFEIILLIVFFNIFIFSLLELKNIKNRKNVETRKYLEENNFEENVFLKWIGVLFGILSILFLWWFLPIYSSTYHIPLWLSIKYVLPITILFSFPLIYFTEKKLGSYRDTYYEFGLFATLNFKNIDWQNFKEGLWSWFIRFFFLPMNFCTAVSMLDNLRNTTNLEMFLLHSPITLSYPVIDDIIFLLLIIAIIPGYYFSSRLLGTNQISISQTWPAWIVTLWFYPPFNKMASSSWFDYTNTLQIGQENWITVLQNSPYLIYFFATILISMALIHFWGEAILGMRASINSNKGIITNGPYKYSKHPIYLSKNIAWLLGTLPFLSGANFSQSFKLTLAFICVSLGYGFRSYFEEKLLAKDETYVAYARYMDEKGLLRFINKIFPFMSFKWRYEYWKKKGDI